VAGVVNSYLVWKIDAAASPSETKLLGFQSETETRTNESNKEQA
jgi:hypothetical protein